jgi:tetratricopeptide (TPR) repeat protein
MKLVREGGATPEAQAYIVRVIEAATTYQKAEISFRRGDMAKALELCKLAAEGDPTQGDYIALLAWMESMDPKRQDPASTRERIAHLDRALSINARSDRAHYYRGMLYKKLGDSKLALLDMKRAIELNPRNVDAPREIRLLESRQAADPSRPEARPSREMKAVDAPPTSKLGGLFSKILKK